MQRFGKTGAFSGRARSEGYDTFASTMYIDTDAESVAARVRDSAFQFLRVEYPYMKLEAVQQLAKKLYDTTRDGIVEQQPLMIRTKSRIGFFSLSAELRNRIYEYALEIDNENPNEIRLAYYSQGYHVIEPESPRLPVLLRVCRQIRGEVAPIYFGRTRFVVWCQYCFPGPAGAQPIPWLQVIGPKLAALIKHFVVKYLQSKDELKRELVEHFGFGKINKATLLNISPVVPHQYGIKEKAVRVEIVGRSDIRF